MIRDVRRAFGNGRSLLALCAAALVGFVFVVAATVLIAPAIADPPHDLAFVELFTFLVALALEYAIGNDLRAFAGWRRR